MDIHGISMRNINLHALRRFDLNTLLTLHGLLETCSVSKTAELMCLGQPAISHVLKRLREQIGDPLIVRRGQGYQLSPHAESIREELAECLSRIAKMISPPAPFDPSSAHSEVHLSMPDLAELVLLPELTRRLQSEAPGILLRVESTIPDNLEEALNQSRVDAAIGYLPMRYTGIVREHLFRTRICCVYNPQCLTLKAPVCMEALAGVPHLTTQYPGAANSVIDHWLRKRGLSRRVLVSTGSFQSLMSLLETTPGVALLPEAIVRIAGEPLCVVPLADPDLYLTIDLVWHPRNNLNPLLVYLRDMLREISRQVI